MILSKNFFAKKRQGFTLIELLVTVAIMLTITGGGIAAFVGFNDRQNVQVAVKDLQTLLRAAQIKAKVGENAESCRVDYLPAKLFLRSYRVYIDSDTNTAILSAVCTDQKFPPYGRIEYIERSRISFDSNVTASIQGGGNVDVEFLALLGGVDGAGIVEISGLGSYVYDFEITSSGEIREGAFQ